MFQDSSFGLALTEDTHNDKTKHLIGDSIPGSTSTTGLVSNAPSATQGTSTIPAREDHTHWIPNNLIVSNKFSNAVGELGGEWNTWNATTFTNVTGGTIAGYWLQVGKLLYLHARITAGTATAAGQCRIILPNGQTGANQDQHFHCYNNTALSAAYTPASSTSITLSSNSALGTNFALGANLANIRISGFIHTT